MNSRSRNGNPTIKDVALACGVSVATVSYVINEKRVLRQDTRDKVKQVMLEMNYHPSAVAQGLSSKRLHTVGVLLGAVNPVDFALNTYSSGILQGVVIQGQREKFNITLFTDPWHNVVDSALQLRDGRTDGILVVGPRLDSDILDYLSSVNVPTVAISAESKTNIPVVDVDNAAGARLAVQHLLELGHRRIAYLSGNDDLASFQPRWEGFIASLRAAGIEPDPELMQVSDFNGSLASAQTAALLQRSLPPTAIVAGNDYIALAAIEMAHSLGINVPGQFSVIGFDNMLVAAQITPSLTSIHQPLAEIGASATHLLIDRIRHRGSDQIEAPGLFAPTLIVRNSTGPAPH